MRLRSLFFLFCFSVFSLFAQEAEIVSLIEKLKHAPISLKSIEGGLTNINYVAEAAGDRYFVRCSSENKKWLDTSWKREYDAMLITSSYGISPAICLAAPQEHVLITTFIDAKTVNTKDPATLKKVCDLLYSLHHLDIRFPITQHPLDIINLYIENTKQIGIDLPRTVVETLLPAIKNYKSPHALPNQLTPCHLDLHKGNILDDGQKLWFIDWEYAAMSDPFFDLAIIASTDLFSVEETKQLLALYLKSDPTKGQLQHFYFLRSLADLRWALWSYIQSKTSPINAPFSMQGDQFLKQSIFYLDSAKCN
ncbi:MAG: phosphotransferase [Chlamydiales bacterium]|nr:phosphotransferase [Chlamydiales bacterium]